MVWAPDWGVSPLTLTCRGGRLDHMRVIRPWLGGSALALKILELRGQLGLVRWYEPPIGGSLLSPSLVEGVDWTIRESWDPNWGDLLSPSKYWSQGASWALRDGMSPQLGGLSSHPSLVEGVNWTIRESWNPNWGDLLSLSTHSDPCFREADWAPWLMVASIGRPPPSLLVWVPPFKKCLLSFIIFLYSMWGFLRSKE
jgi:hypothetical protein